MQLGRCTDIVEPFTAFDNDNIPMYMCYLCTIVRLLWMLYS